MKNKPFFITNIEGRKCVQLLLSPKIYSLDTIFAAGYVFLDRCYLILDEDKNKNIKVIIFPKKSSKNKDLEKLGMEFYNEVLNYAHYFSRAKATKGVVEKILQRVLFSASPALIEESEEREIQELLKELEKEEKDLTSDFKEFENEKNNSKKKK